jgi:hypothetical protein
MSPTNELERGAPLAALLGRTCDGVAPWSGANTAVFRFGDAVLQVECLWRVVGAGRLLVTSEDHSQLFGRTVPVDAHAEADRLLCRKRVTTVSSGTVEADVVLTLDQDLRLEVLPDSSGYEAWLFRMPGLELVGVGGGHVVRV